MSGAPGGVTLRATEPGDAPAMAALLASAFPAGESTRLGMTYVRGFAAWFARRPQPLSRVATVESELAGLVVGLRDEEIGALYRALLPRALAAALRRPSALLHAEVAAMAAGRLRAALASPATMEGGTLLHTIAVAPGKRDRGVGAALLHAFVAAARDDGARLVHLRVLAENAGARRFYERHGWRESPGLRAGRRVAYVAPEDRGAQRAQGSSRGPGSPSGRVDTPAVAASSSSPAGSSPGLT